MKSTPGVSFQYKKEVKTSESKGLDEEREDLFHVKAPSPLISHYFF